jgi:hypothetical protein
MIGFQRGETAYAMEKARLSGPERPLLLFDIIGFLMLSVCYQRSQS